MSDDVLSEVLRAVRLKGAVFFSVHASAPWVAESPPSRELAPYLMPGVEHVIEYHVLTEGSCYAGIVNEDPFSLRAGDIVVFPQGDANVMSSAPGMRGSPSAELESKRAALDQQRLPLQLSLGGGGSARSHLVCGFLGCDARPFNPLLANLPRVLHVRPTPDDPLLSQFVALALRESSAPTAGSDCVLARLCELMFIEVVRRYIANLPSEQTGWLSGLRDPLVGRALAALHGRPAQPWTLELLARQVGASRSILAERFMLLVGVPPMQYLAQWRMQLAASMLSASNVSLAEVAEAIGYGSEAALSRAFKRQLGVPPTSYRRSARSLASGS